jgi:hypothetical protein
MDLLDRILLCVDLCESLYGRLVASAERLLEGEEERTTSCLSPLRAAAARLKEHVVGQADRHVKLTIPSSKIGEVLDWLDVLNDDEVHIKEIVAGVCAGYQASENAGQMVCEALARYLGDYIERRIKEGDKLSQKEALLLECCIQEVWEALRTFCRPSELRRALGTVRYMCTLVSVERVEDVHDIWDPSAGLSLSDVRAVLSRRKEVVARDLAALRLKG